MKSGNKNINLFAKYCRLFEKKIDYKNYCIFIIIISSFSVLFSGNSYADQTVKIGIYNFPPFHELKDEKFTGIWINPIKNIFEKANMKYSMRQYPTLRLIDRIVKGETDFALAGKGISAFENNTLYSSSVFSNIGVSIYTRADTPVPKNKEELREKNILVTRGYNYGGLLKYFQAPENHIKLDPANRHELVFRKLKEKRADYAVDYTSTGSEMLKRTNFSGIQSHQIFNFDIYFIISKKTPNYQKIMDKIEKAFEEIKAAE